MPRRRRGLQVIYDEMNEPRLRVNLAPLVDISLSLVIMFILSIPFILESGIFVSRGAAASSRTRVVRQISKEKVTVNLYLRADGTLLLNGQPTDWEALPELIPELLKRSKTKTAVVSADSTVVYKDVIRLIDLAKLSGALDVTILKRRSR